MVNAEDANLARGIGSLPSLGNILTDHLKEHKFEFGQELKRF